MKKSLQLVEFTVPAVRKGRLSCLSKNVDSSFLNLHGILDSSKDHSKATQKNKQECDRKKENKSAVREKTLTNCE